MNINHSAYVGLKVNELESEAVKIAVLNLKRDLRRVLDCRVNVSRQLETVHILVGTAGVSEEFDREAKEAVARIREKGKGTENADHQGNAEGFHREGYALYTAGDRLIIAGADRRGTIYGIYTFCEKWLGVSPWYFMADVPVRHKRTVTLGEGLLEADWPILEYRGIFINDEEELERWVQRYMGEDTIGIKTYVVIFELLLRLKLNYIWPAMHVNSFNAKRENGELADRMGIVVGTSHCDMLMRSNNREWKPWLKKKGYEGAEYDYSVPGRNREILDEYWRESIQQNKEFEVSYTLGMRGVHDSGFETRSLAGKSGDELLRAKIDLLDTVIKAQENMLSEEICHPVQKNFVPYKEVLELYDNGLPVPEDLTLIWVNDNYGYVRRYPNEKEKSRKAGNGIYYHNSYWAAPGDSYLFICSTPLTQTKNELEKAWNEGIQKLWVTNFGALKPLEMQMSFYGQLCWDAGKETKSTDDVKKWVCDWLAKSFSIAEPEKLAGELLSFDQVVNTRKLEHMRDDVFSQTAWGDEAAMRMNRLKEIADEGSRVYETLPEEEKDSFFQMVLMKLHAAYFTAGMYYFADRSRQCIRTGKNRAAKACCDKSHAFDKARRELIHYYNHIMADGKWEGILLPEDFAPPRTAMYPACMPPIEDAFSEKNAGESGQEENAGAIISLWNDEEKLIFSGREEKWLEIACAGSKKVEYTVKYPAWLQVRLQSEPLPAATAEGACLLAGETGDETRLVFALNEEILRLAGSSAEGEIEIQIYGEGTGEKGGNGMSEPGRQKRIKVRAEFSQEDAGLTAAPEEDGRICVEAEAAEEVREAAGSGKTEGTKRLNSGTGAWKKLPWLARYDGALMEARKKEGEWRAEEGALTYRIRLNTPGEHLLELHRFPTLNSVGRLRFMITCDDNEPQLLESPANDEHRGSWRRNILNAVDKLYLKLPYLRAGMHTILIQALDPYLSFSRFVIYTEQKKVNSLGRKNLLQHLPQASPEELTRLYGNVIPEPRPVVVGDPGHYSEDIHSPNCVLMEPGNGRYAGLPRELACLGAASDEPAIPEKVFAEEDGNLSIDVQSVLAGKACAWYEGEDWMWCDSPLYGGKGLGLYRFAEDPDHENPAVSGEWRDPQSAPSLNFRVHLKGGKYRVWMYLWHRNQIMSRFSVKIDGILFPEKEMNGGRFIDTYSTEQVWSWLQAADLEITPGDHVLGVTAIAAGIRYGRILLEPLSEE